MSRFGGRGMAQSWFSCKITQRIARWSAAERRGNNSRYVEDFALKAKARFGHGNEATGANCSEEDMSTSRKPV